MSNHLTFPSDIRSVLSSNARIEKETHAGLWLDKYIEKQMREDKSSRSQFVQEVATLTTSTTYQMFYTRWEQSLKKFDAKTRRAMVKGRMIVGLGSESVLETSICLHRTYGVPYIPGSALKGLAANYAQQHLSTSGDWKKGGKYHQVIFGDTDEAGYLTFFDALYIPGTGHNKKALHTDVITAHHPDYYQGLKPPTDKDSPNPVPFLTATGEYLVALAAPDLEKPTDWITITFKLLELALQTLGIGAKTSSGYGRMELLVDPEIKKAEGYKQEISAVKNIASEMPNHHRRWQQIKSPEARMLLAKTIVARVRQTGSEKAVAEKPWYKELQAFIGEE